MRARNILFVALVATMLPASVISRNLAANARLLTTVGHLKHELDGAQAHGITQDHVTLLGSWRGVGGGIRRALRALGCDREQGVALG